VLHRPGAGLTVQIGDGAALSRRLGIPVVHDLRAADVAAGGQGAPLVPIYHQALVAAAGLDRPIGVLNLGGVANLTLVRASGDPLSCDTGPANALIDDLMLERTGAPVDKNGEIAARGGVDAGALTALMTHPYFEEKPPKSLDRNAFSRDAVSHLTTEDAAATLVAFTAHSVLALWKHLPEQPLRVIACGGGTHNPTLMRVLNETLPCPVESADAYGWSADAMEAEAFAYLAVRSLKGLPLTFPTTTGAPRPLTGGVLARAA
jgi:anhydro-N-acetylmuramic acid kinase